MTILHLDFETRSACDLKAAGLANYAADPSTDVLCVAYAFDDAPPALARNHHLGGSRGVDTFDFLAPVFEHIRGGGPVYAHNAAFELAIGNEVMAKRYGWPTLQLEQMRCTMAMALAMGLPASLEHLSAALGIEKQKDMSGHRVMLQLCRPRKVVDHPPRHDGSTGYQEIVWWDDPDKLATLYAYCKQDVEAERECHRRMLELTDDEQELWRLYARINERGIPVDLPNIDRAMDLVDAERKRLDEAMRAITGNTVAGCTDVRQLTAWLRYRGVTIAGVAKADVLDALSADGLPDDCRQALLLRQEAAKSSTAKLKAMRSGASPDGRVCGCIQHHGAHTGRSAGRRVQPLNMPRPSVLKTPGHVEDAIAHLDDPQYLDMMYGAPMTVLADCLRGVICAPEGHEFVCCDFSNIEGRVIAWLAGENWKLQAFRDFDAGVGSDLYKLAYARAFHIHVDDVDDRMRQVGKVMELALAYGGGIGAFQTMARGYGVDVSDARADELKDAWRKAHPKIVQFWYDLERAAIEAVRSGAKTKCRSITFVKRGSFLFARGPSGRVMVYPYPEIRPVKTPWGAMKDALTYMSVDSISRKWKRTSTYGGSLAENFTQFTARDIQTAAMLRIEKLGHPIVFEVYDEIVVEAPTGALQVDTVAKAMTTLPPWAKGLPVAAEGWAGRRYRKD